MCGWLEGERPDEEQGETQHTSDNELNEHTPLTSKRARTAVSSVAWLDEISALSLGESESLTPRWWMMHSWFVSVAWMRGGLE